MCPFCFLSTCCLLSINTLTFFLGKCKSFNFRFVSFWSDAILSFSLFLFLKTMDNEFWLYVMIVVIIGLLLVLYRTLLNVSYHRPSNVFLVNLYIGFRLKWFFKWRHQKLSISSSFGVRLSQKRNWAGSEHYVQTHISELLCLFYNFQLYSF